MQISVIIIAIMMLTISYNQEANAEREFKHGFLIGTSTGNTKGDVRGKHLDYKNFIGNNLEAITEENANVLDALISSSRSVGYNLRSIPETGWGYEIGIYKTNIKISRQKNALKHDDGSAFTQNTATGPVDIIVESPSSEIETIDIYFGGLYRFTAVRGVTPYLGAGYTKTKGKWKKSYYSGVPNGPEYGTKGETDVKGNNSSVKVGLDFDNGFSLEYQYSKNELKADSFRSFNINGADTEYKIKSLNLLYHF